METTAPTPANYSAFCAGLAIAMALSVPMWVALYWLASVLWAVM